MRSIEHYYEPANILGHLACNKTEMSGKELAFLCGLIKKYRPEKIVEIGVAAGGTTAVILNCISILQLDAQVVSLDLSENYYRDNSKKTGFLIDECREILDKKLEHTLYTGKFAVEYLETVGADIDFLILDTVHSLPGELLDFLACYPFLKLGSVVVLHDILLNQCSNNLDGFATRILLDTVAAEKILDMEGEISSIGAFIVTEDTGKYIENVFSALSITWRYKPGDTEINLYREFYSKYYSKDNLKLFDMAVQLNKKTLDKRALIKQNEFLNIYRWIEALREKRVYIYGCGNFGKQFYQLLKKCDVQVMGYIVSDGQNKMEDGQDIYFLSEVCIDKEKDLILIGVGEVFQEEICSVLKKKGVLEYIFPNEYIYDYLIR